MIEIIDVGASTIDGEPEYAPLLSAGLAHVTGFDCQELRESTSQRTYLPFLLGDGNEHLYYRYASPGLNGFFELSDEITALGLPRAQLLGTELMETKRLDDVRHGPCDLLKLDCQGSELMVLYEAQETLRSALLVQIEMSLYPLYKNQPAMGYLDHYLRFHDFLPFSLISRRALPSGQWIDADFLYAKHSSLCGPNQESTKQEIIRRCYSQQSPRFTVESMSR